MDDNEYSDDELLKRVTDERRRSLGFSGDATSGELQADRELALLYYKRDMRIPALENRSEQCSNDIADAIHQVLPQIVEVFMDEEVAAFRPTNAQDIDAAQQASDYINHVIFKQNNGFHLLTTTCHDALLLKTGYWVWHWEEPPEPETEDYVGMSQLDWLNAEMSIQAGENICVAYEPQPDGTFNYTLSQPRKEGRLIIESWPPEDVAVSVDTNQIGDGDYCAFRTRVRRDQLIADGYDPDIVAELPGYAPIATELDYARDQAGEYEEPLSSGVDGSDSVEIIYHYVKVLDAGRMKIAKVTTGGQEDAKLLRREYIDSVPAASITPIPIPHRHYGQSLADLMRDIQEVRTALLRLALDSGYFALNQRYEVAEDGASQYTIGDLMDNNTPGAAVRSKSGQTVRPIQGGAPTWDVWSALEEVAVAGEQRSGVLRSTMGINQDSLHETKGGMLSMMNMGQTRVRFIARNFAETGFRRMVLGVYDMIRQHATMEQIVRVNGTFVPVNPTTWAARDDLDIEICNGGGRDYDIAGLQQIVGVFKDVVAQQGGLNGPLVNAANTAYLLRRLIQRLGRRDADMLVADPGQAQQMVQQASQQPHADPEAAKAQAAAQAQQQFDQQQAAARMQADKDRSDAEMQLAMWKAQQDVALQQRKMEMEQQTKRWQIEQELNLKRQEIGSQAQLDMAAMHSDAALSAHKMALDHDINQQRVDAVPLAEVEPGGEGG